MKGNISQEILKRKGARKVQEVPTHILDLLNQGEIETVNLTEWLAIDHISLVKCVLPGIDIEKPIINEIVRRIQSQKKPSAMNSTKLIGATLYEFYKLTKSNSTIFNKLSKHKSDSIRSYSPFLISLNPNLDIDQKLSACKVLIADQHFGVREVVWIALRPAIENRLIESIQILSKWAEYPNENIRRFTTEVTRPRGVWCKHIEKLKTNPELALPILEKLKSDQSKYVQDSVGNWLNDASKSQPEFVKALCQQWQKESPTKETEKIIKRARRTIDKK